MTVCHQRGRRCDSSGPGFNHSAHLTGSLSLLLSSSKRDNSRVWYNNVVCQVLSRMPNDRWCSMKIGGFVMDNEKYTKSLEGYTIRQNGNWRDYRSGEKIVIDPFSLSLSSLPARFFLGQSCLSLSVPWRCLSSPRSSVTAAPRKACLTHESTH